MNGDAGKGDTYRPVNPKVYGENFDRIFNKEKHAPTPNDNETPGTKATGPLGPISVGFDEDVLREDEESR